MKSVAGRVRADKPFTIADGFQERRLAGFAHRWLFVGARAGQVACRVKAKCVIFCDVLRREHAAIFRAGDCEIMFLSKLRQYLFGMAQFTVRPPDRTVLKAGGLGEKKNLLRLCGCERRKTATEQGQNGETPNYP